MSFLRNLLFYIFVGTKFPKKDSPAILLFEIGSLQVFHYPTADELNRNLMPKEVYWQSIKTRQTFGPFPGIQQAMIHYTRYTTMNKSNPEPVGNVIHLDFRNKTRV